MSTGLNWHSGKPYTEPVKPNEIVNNKINYDAPNSSRLDDYLRVDFSAKYRFTINNKVKAQFGISIWNILNRQNVINRYFSITDNNLLESSQQFSLGRTPNLIFRVNF